MRNYSVVLALALLLSLISAFIELVGPYLLSEFIGAINEKKNALIFLGLYGAFLIGGKIIDSLHGYIVDRYNAKTIERLRMKASDWLMMRRRYGRLPLDEGGVVSRLTADIDAVTQLLASPLNGLVPEIIKGVGALILLVRIHWIIAILSICVLPLFYYITKKVNNVSKLNAKRNREIKSSITSYFMDFVKNYRIFVCYDGKDEEMSYVEELGSDLTRNGIRQSINMARYFAMISALRGFVVLISLLVAYKSIVSGVVEVGAVIMIVSYVQSVFTPVLQLSRYTNQIAQANVAVQRVFELEPQKGEWIGDFREENMGTIYHLKVKNLSLAYENEKQCIVQNVNFEIQSPGLVCLFGRSGGGKSTILHALCGLIPIKAGCIMVNGEDYTDRMFELTLDKKIRVVFQNVFLFNRTLKENILYGMSEKQKSEDFIRDFGAKLGLMRLLYDRERSVQNGVNGETISGGEKRRVGLLRGLNHKAAVYLLDEPTSELDGENSKLVLDLIQELKEKAIVIISTHDEAFLKIADCVINV